MSEDMQAPMIGRIVWYRSRTGAYTVPAIITCTVDSLYEPAVEAGIIPALSSESHVHLTVCSPGVPQVGENAPQFETTSMQAYDLPPGAKSHNLAGTYQEWDIPLWDSMNARYWCSPKPGINEVEQAPGTWIWPWRGLRAGEVL
jgi:hypothetical protein